MEKKIRELEMEENSEWGINIEDCNDETLLNLYRLLKDRNNDSKKIEIQKELIKRARVAGDATIKDIINVLVQGKRKKERSEIAKEWSEALDISEKDFKKMANG